MTPAIDADPGLIDGLSGRYAIERELGRGGMATVYLARDLKHKRHVALKVLHPELGAAVGAERFLREIETTARLQHPHILPIFDSGEAVGYLWYTMPFVEGESLRDRLTRETRLESAEAIRLVTEAASALDYAHRHGVIHRDIKPGNILLSDGHALVADFGIARNTGPDGRETLTATGHSLGTPAYMAPEQSSGRDFDHRVDVYALGCVLYELLAGTPPYVRTSAPALIAAHMVEPVPDLRLARPDVPPAVGGVVARAMAKEPGQRFESAAAFAAALNGGQGASATPLSTVPLPARVLRHRSRWPLAAAAVLAFVVGMAVWIRQRSPDRASAPTLMAVLPFENHGTPEDEPFADGLADEVRGKLTEVPGLAVIARGSSGRYKRTPKSPQEIGRELGVRYLLTGTVRWDRSAPGERRVRVNPELLDVGGAGQATTRWQAPFEAPVTDVFRLQAAIASQVATALNLELSPGTKQRLERQPTTNLAAYEAYLKAIGDPAEGDLANQGPAQLRRSIAELERAVALDPSFAQAWASLARAKLYLHEPDSTTLHAVARALATDSMLPAVRLAAGLVAGYADRDTLGALRHFEAGLAASPDNPELLTALAWERFDPRKPEQMLAMIQRAQTLDPLSPRVANRLFLALCRSNRRREAIEAADQVARLAPRSEDGIVFPITARLAAGEEAEALELIVQGLVGPDSARFVTAIQDGPFWLLDDAHLNALLTLPLSVFGGDRAQRARLERTIVRLRAIPDSSPLSPEAERRQLGQELAARPDHQDLWLALAYHHTNAGNLRAAHQALERLKHAAARSSWRVGPWTNVGALYAKMGEADSAARYMASVIGTKHGSYNDREAADIRFAPYFARVRATPQFRPILAHLDSGSQRRSR